MYNLQGKDRETAKGPLGLRVKQPLYIGRQLVSVDVTDSMKCH